MATDRRRPKRRWGGEEKRAAARSEYPEMIHRQNIMGEKRERHMTNKSGGNW